MNLTICGTVAGTAALLATSSAVFGAGFQLAERSAGALGRAFSGEAAIGDDGGAVPLINNTENWNDSMRFAIVATYKHNDKLTLRCGLAYDESPVPDSAHRTLRIPDGDRIWGSLGLSYQLNPCYRLDVGYTHIFDTDASINEPASANPGNPTGNGVFTGTASGDVDLIALGVSGTF